MYKDKAKQRQAVREAVRRHRAKGITRPGITVVDEPPDVIPNETIARCEARLESVPVRPILEVLPTQEDVERVSRERIVPQSYNSMMVGYVPKEPKL